MNVAIPNGDVCATCRLITQRPRVERAWMLDVDMSSPRTKRVHTSQGQGSSADQNQACRSNAIAAYNLKHAVSSDTIKTIGLHNKPDAAIILRRSVPNSPFNTLTFNARPLHKYALPRTHIPNPSPNSHLDTRANKCSKRAHSDLINMPIRTGCATYQGDTAEHGRGSSMRDVGRGEGCEWVLD